MGCWEKKKWKRAVSLYRSMIQVPAHKTEHGIYKSALYHQHTPHATARLGTESTNIVYNVAKAKGD
jgi:hypothetical protein